VTQFRMILELEKSHASKRIRDLHLSTKIRDRNETAIKVLRQPRLFIVADRVFVMHSSIFGSIHGCASIEVVNFA